MFKNVKIEEVRELEFWTLSLAVRSNSSERAWRSLNAWSASSDALAERDSIFELRQQRRQRMQMNGQTDWDFDFGAFRDLIII